jgi:hypothetical protein
MPVTAKPSQSKSGGPPPTLASRHFPRRVRRLLEGVLEFAADQLDRDIEASLNDFEQQLFKMAEQAHSNDVQLACFESLRNVKRGRSDVVPRFMIGLEAALASIRDGQTPADAGEPAWRAGELALLEHGELDERTVLREVASRAESRASLPLWLLGQRFGVLAGKPAFEPEHIPVGPHQLCELFGRATGCLDLTTQNRALLFRSFERMGLPQFSAFVEAINAFLIAEDVLPRLTFVPIRIKPGDRPSSAGAPRRRRDDGIAAQLEPGEADADQTRDNEPRKGSPPLGAERRAIHPRTQWPGEATANAAESEPPSEEMFSLLRNLLASRRQLLAKLGQGEASPAKDNARVASPEDVRSVLSVLQQRPVPNGEPGDPIGARPVRKIKEDLLMQLRMISPEGEAAQLPEADSDSIELVGMLFEHIMRDVRPNSPASALLSRLQVPLLRLAMDDAGFFTQTQHPARQMLNTIAETGAQWLGEEETDRTLIEKMQLLVDRAVTEFNGDPAVFESLQQDLGQQVQAAVRRAETAERRHIEAARGKERLALSQKRASEAISEKLAKRKVPQFVRTLLTQAWADVLALTLLRHGEESEEFAHQMALAERLITASMAEDGSSEALSIEDAVGVEEEVVRSLAHVGYHNEDAEAIARRLVRKEEADASEDAASRTELALRLKARTRLGRNAADQEKSEKKLPPLTDAEKQSMEQIKQLPFGTWFEFVHGQGDKRVRRRMSWYSTVTGHALFVNHRGQRVGEHTLDWLARAMAAGKAEIVQTDKGTLIDRAWSAIMGALRSFAGRDPATGAGP